jgi:hypothetical protein
MNWADDRRKDRADARAQDRADRAAAAQLAENAATAKAARKAAAQVARDVKRKAAREARSVWLAEHRPDLLIYALWVVSAALAVPAMASYGMSLYGPLGASLFVLSEAGGAAFAFAVQARHAATEKDGADRPTGMLTVGIGLFATVGAALNFLHGLSGGGVVRGVVMALVSVAGIVAHQLVVAAPPRSRAERAAARQARYEARRTGRAQRRAARTAVVRIAADGTATLVYPTGDYLLRRRGLAPLADLDRKAHRPANARRRGTGTTDAGPAPVPPTDAVPVPRTATRRTGTGATDRRGTGTTSPTGTGATRRPGSGRHALAELLAPIPADDPRSDRQLAADLAPAAGLTPATARRYLAEIRTTTTPTAVPATTGGGS